MIYANKKDKTRAGPAVKGVFRFVRKGIIRVEQAFNKDDSGKDDSERTDYALKDTRQWRTETKEQAR